MLRIFTFLAIFFTASCLRASETGRYIRVELPDLPTIGDRVQDMRRMMEIEVFSSGKNVAPNAVLSCSSGAGGDKIKALVDGNTKDFFISAFIIIGQVNPWIELDLGRAMPVEKVLVHCGSRPRAPLSWLVSVLDAERKVAWYQRADIPPNAFVPQPMKGRYIGRALPEKVASWYSVLGEQPQERRFELLTLELPRLPNAERRQREFAQRDSAESVAALCKRFHAAVDANAKGLETFRRRFESGDFRGALEAYRDFFFDRLANPEKHGVPADWLGSVWHNPVDIGVNSIAAEEAGLAQEKRALVLELGRQLEVDG